MSKVKNTDASNQSDAPGLNDENMEEQKAPENTTNIENMASNKIDDKNVVTIEAMIVAPLLIRRIRAGVTFTREKAVYEVSSEQYSKIITDKALRVKLVEG